MSAPEMLPHADTVAAPHGEPRAHDHADHQAHPAHPKAPRRRALASSALAGGLGARLAVAAAAIALLWLTIRWALA